MNATPGTRAAVGDADAESSVEEALRAGQVRSHALNITVANLASAVVALMLAAALGSAVPRSALLLWLGILVSVLLGRTALQRVHDRAPIGHAPSSLWLRRYRLGALAHGIAWGLAGVLFHDVADFNLQVTLLFVLAGMAAGAMTLTLFDLTAALLFAGPTLLPLVAQRSGNTGPAPVVSAAVAVMLMVLFVFFVIAAGRARRERRELAMAEHAEHMRAEFTRRNESLLRMTFEHMGEGLAVIDRELRLVAWNTRFLEFTRLDPTVARVGAPLYDCLLSLAQAGEFGPGSPVTLAARRLAELTSEGQNVMQRSRADGALIELRRNPTPGGGFVLTVIDITQRTAAEAALAANQRMLSLLLEATAQGFWLIDNDLNTQDVNPAMCRMLGLTREGMLGRNIYEFVDAENEAIFRHHVKERAAGRADSYEITLLHANGSRVDCFNNATPVFDDMGKKVGAVGFFSDITQIKRTERALIAARDEADRANRAKSEFLSRMSHELRTPMNAILGFGQLLESDTQHPLSDVQSAHVQQLLRGGRHLLNLINEVLDLARIESGTLPLQLQPVDVPALLEDCLRLVQPVTQGRQIRLQARLCSAGLGHARADQTRLKQVLLNLLSNAIKYNRDGGQVLVVCAPRGERLRIEVQDTGPGLTPDQQQRLFQAFERLDADKSAVEGAGIGLALCKLLVELMQGEIGVDSLPGAGSTFWIELARVEAPEVALLPAPSEPLLNGLDGAVAGREHTVLYIEDNPVNQVLMESMLAHLGGLRLLTAAHPREGLELAHAEHPALILLDIQLPDMDGYEVLRRLRTEPATRRIPVIAVSANAMQVDIDQALQAGFTDYLTKPLDMPRLLQVVGDMLHTQAVPPPGGPVRPTA